ncbi:MAG: MerR family transcriptional regulator [Anaerolineae bacterium]
MSGKTYQISELAKLAGVTVRTIRYYISQGLLPSPTSSGQFDRYDDSYLHKLELIRRLKEEYLPLDKIRDLITSMSDEAIQAEVASSNALPAESGSARDYVRSVLYPDEAVSLNKRLANRVAEPQVHTGGVIHNEQRSYQTSRVARSAAPAPPQALGLFAEQERETWLRYRIHPDIELHVREQPAHPRVRQRLPKLLIELRRLCYLLELDEKEPENE